jgi:hypothetical protein
MKIRPVMLIMAILMVTLPVLPTGNSKTSVIPAFAVAHAQGDSGLPQASPGLPQPSPARPDADIPQSSLSKKQRQDLLKDNFKHMKKEADELADLAKSLQSDVEKSNAAVMSLEIVRKAKRIEKLSKKIQDAAKGY